MEHQFKQNSFQEDFSENVLSTLLLFAAGDLKGGSPGFLSSLRGDHPSRVKLSKLVFARWY